MNNKRGPKPNLRNRIILSIREKKIATSADLAVSTAYLSTLEKKGIIAVKERKKKEGKGRPNNVYSLTPRGHGFALNLSKKAV